MLTLISRENAILRMLEKKGNELQINYGDREVSELGEKDK